GRGLAFTNSPHQQHHLGWPQLFGRKEGATVDGVNALTGAAPVHGYVATPGAAKHPRVGDTGATLGTAYPLRMKVFPQPHLTHFIVQQPNNRKIHALNDAIRTALGLDMSHAAFAGSGVDNGFGTFTITNSTISGNTASFIGGIGGGVRNNYGTGTVTNSIISGNAGRYAGGVDNSYYPSILSVTNSTISGNTAR